MSFLRLLVVLLLGVIAYAIYSGKAQHPLHFAFPFGGSPAIHDHVAVVRDLAQKILVPLEDKMAPSTASAQKVIANLASELDAHSNAPDIARSRRALTLLESALQERQGIIEKALQKAPEGPFDKTPGIVWHDAWNRGKVVDIEEFHRQARSSYWAGVYLGQWRARCTYYRSAITAVLNQP